MERAKPSRSDAILLGCALFQFIFILDGFFKQPLYAYSPALYWLFDVCKFVPLPLAVLAWLKYRFRVTPAHYGMRAVAEHETWMHFLGLTVFLALILNLVYLVANFLAYNILLHPEINAFYHSIRPEGPLRVFVVAYYAVTAGVVEEIFCRGLPLLYLQERFGPTVRGGAYVVATAVLFGAGHWENGAHEAVSTFVYGLFASALYLKLRDLWPFIGAHIMIDVWAFW